MTDPRERARTFVGRRHALLGNAFKALVHRDYLVSDNGLSQPVGGRR